MLVQVTALVTLVPAGAALAFGSGFPGYGMNRSILSHVHGPKWLKGKYELNSCIQI